MVYETTCGGGRRIDSNLYHRKSLSIKLIDKLEEIQDEIRLNPFYRRFPSKFVLQSMKIHDLFFRALDQ